MVNLTFIEAFLRAPLPCGKQDEDVDIEDIDKSLESREEVDRADSGDRKEATETETTEDADAVSLRTEVRSEMKEEEEDVEAEAEEKKEEVGLGMMPYRNVTDYEDMDTNETQTIDYDTDYGVVNTTSYNDSYVEADYETDTERIVDQFLPKHNESIGQPIPIDELESMPVPPQNSFPHDGEGDRGEENAAPSSLTVGYSASPPLAPLPYASGRSSPPQVRLTHAIYSSSTILYHCIGATSVPRFLPIDF